MNELQKVQDAFKKAESALIKARTKVAKALAELPENLSEVYSLAPQRYTHEPLIDFQSTTRDGVVPYVVGLGKNGDLSFTAGTSEVVKTAISKALEGKPEKRRKMDIEELKTTEDSPPPILLKFA